MKIELSSNQLDEIAQKKIQGLEKEVKSLTRKVATRDRQLRELKARWKLSGGTVSEIREAASHLCDLLEDNDIVEYARYGNTC